MSFSFNKLEIPDLKLITSKIFTDDRGFFLEHYKKSDFMRNGITKEFMQCNHSHSSKGVLRGLHYQQEPYAQAKLVRCIKGQIFDVAVDIRKNSPTFAKWIGLYLSEENKKMLYIPEGFAHGFYTVSDVAEIIYSVTKEYHPQSERGIIWNDPNLNIDWPTTNIILSEKDRLLPVLRNNVYI